MSLSRFVSSLVESGRVRVPVLPRGEPEQSGEFAAAEISGLHEQLDLLDAAQRLELAHEAPPLHRPAARWGAVVVYRACQLLVSATAHSESVPRLLGGGPTPPQPPDVIYSVDLVLRYLPDLHRLTRERGARGALAAALGTLARAWPLSSVGIDLQLERPLSLAPILRHPALAQLYVDRVIERSDRSRLTGEPEVRERVATALGARRELAPELTVALDEGDA